MCKSHVFNNIATKHITDPQEKLHNSEELNFTREAKEHLPIFQLLVKLFYFDPNTLLNART